MRMEGCVLSFKGPTDRQTNLGEGQSGRYSPVPLTMLPRPWHFLKGSLSLPRLCVDLPLFILAILLILPIPPGFTLCRAPPSRTEVLLASRYAAQLLCP